MQHDLHTRICIEAEKAAVPGARPRWRPGLSGPGCCWRTSPQR